MSTTVQNIVKALALVAITMAITIALSSINVTYNNNNNNNPRFDDIKDEGSNGNAALLPSKRVSRFLARNYNNTYDHHGRSLKPADHCNKDNQVCKTKYGENFECCGNKCFDFTIDKKHCGGCRNKCKFTYDCCNGMCVDKAYDKRHCGRCNNKCFIGGYCIYGMCDYA